MSAGEPAEHPASAHVRSREASNPGERVFRPVIGGPSLPMGVRPTYWFVLAVYFSLVVPLPGKIQLQSTLLIGLVLKV